MIDTLALVPPYSPEGLPVTSMTTGNDETPDVVVATTPMEPTVPYTGVVAPDGVMLDWSPTWSCDTPLLDTVEFTT